MLAEIDGGAGFLAEICAKVDLEIGTEDVEFGWFSTKMKHDLPMITSLSLAVALNPIVAGAVHGPPAGLANVIVGALLPAPPDGASKKMPLTTGLDVEVVRVSTNVTWPLTSHDTYFPSPKLATLRLSSSAPVTASRTLIVWSLPRRSQSTM